MDMLHECGKNLVAMAKLLSPLMVTFNFHNDVYVNAVNGVRSTSLHTAVWDRKIHGVPALIRRGSGTQAVVIIGKCIEEAMDVNERLLASVLAMKQMP